MCATLGFHTPHLFPTKEGRDYELTPYLDRLKDHRDDITVFSSLAELRAQGPVSYVASAHKVFAALPIDDGALGIDDCDGGVPAVPLGSPLFEVPLVRQKASAALLSSRTVRT